ncbi:MAG: hypothetical protein AB2A00_10270 [Myxococcota bacterium]
MNLLTILFLVTMALALLFSSWRGVLVALSLQGALMACMVTLSTDHVDAASLVLLTDLVLARTVLGPSILWQAFHARDVDATVEMLPANLFLWCVATTTGVAGFWFAARLYPTDLAQTTVVGAAFSQVMLGLFSLVYQRTVMGQVLGLLVIESGILFFEVTGGHHLPWFLQAMVSAVFLGLVLLAARFSAMPAASGVENDVGEVL